MKVWSLTWTVSSRRTSVSAATRACSAAPGSQRRLRTRGLRWRLAPGRPNSPIAPSSTTDRPTPGRRRQFADQGGLIVDGANQLAAGGNDLVTGHAQLLSGDRQLGTGLWLYASGVDSYASGVRQFSDGLGVLGAGGQELSGGADTLRDETSDMDQQMTERIDEAMADFLPSEFTLVSFADPRNTGIERVQFVYLVDAQTEPRPSLPNLMLWVTSRSGTASSTSSGNPRIGYAGNMSTIVGSVSGEGARE